LGLSFDPLAVQTHLQQASEALEDMLNRPLMSSAGNSPPMVAPAWPAAHDEWSQSGPYAASAPTAMDVPRLAYQPLLSYDYGMLSPRSTLRHTPSECGDVHPREDVEFFAHATDGWYTVGLATPPPHLHAVPARFDYHHALLESAMSSPAMLPSSTVIGTAPSEADEDEDDDSHLPRCASLPEPLDCKDGVLDETTVHERIRIMEERTKLVRRRLRMAGRGSGSSSTSSSPGKAKPTCVECQKTFSRKHNLHQHTLRMHNPDRKRMHNCEHCDKSFDRQADLNRHLDSVRVSFGRLC
jgi:hypothetical protein